ncbi:HAD family hydrolase [Cyanobacterium sp. Dongsha4]|uniref:D-glycero-alpha-D-manno-heptose-1,7-bisphosphate 7-phosphatase n=1 Tax=Cyanobacterium sp. DS4 TaxID=2878255 RepID=UPI002E7FEB25|nr:HAD family hydrolase [Cyanobacterium sp. Dongsha4]WVL01734.1 HAD family hydrolase [Cyanobacterium sp. Dongsha4]
MKALFLDRDGVVIEYIPYLSKPEQVKIPENAPFALQQWQNQGYRLVIVTNQSGISRGYFTLEEVRAIHEQLMAEYASFDVYFTDILICPHQPSDNCLCRKPSPFLIKTYAENNGIDLSQSYFIGDAPSDIECAINAKCQPVLLLTGRGRETLTHLSQYSLSIPVFEQMKDTISLLKTFAEK